MNDFQKTSSEETSSKNKIIKAAFFCGIAIFAIVICIPLLINELYKCNAGYVTMWNAADVLAYYGNVLNGCITTGTVAATILFTYWQIKRDRYLEKNLSTWKQVDDIVTNALIDISPNKLIFLNFNVSGREALIREWLTVVIEYDLKVTSALTMISAYVNVEKNTEFSAYIDQFQITADRYHRVCQNLEKELSSILEMIHSKNAKEVDLQPIKESIREMNVEYNVSYQFLIDEKRKTFDDIYRNIETEADGILLLNKQRKGKVEK